MITIIFKAYMNVTRSAPHEFITNVKISAETIREIRKKRKMVENFLRDEVTVPVELSVI